MKQYQNELHCDYEASLAVYNIKMMDVDLTLCAIVLCSDNDVLWTEIVLNPYFQNKYIEVK